MRPSRPAHACTFPAPRRGRVLTWLLVAITTACSRHIEEEPPIPEHRLEPCETWCAMLFDSACPQPVEVESEEACFDGCLAQDIVWAPVGDDQDACESTYVPYVDCMASLSCAERTRHFDLINAVPDEELSACGGLLRAQLDCQAAHD